MAKCHYTGMCKLLTHTREDGQNRSKHVVFIHCTYSKKFSCVL